MARWALVTGASQGIGLELARLAAVDGYGLVLVARSQDRLEALAIELRRSGGEALTLGLDLSRRDAAERLVEWLGGRGIVPELLCNNAGIGAYGLHRDVPLAAEQELLDLNVVTLTRLTKLLLPAMLARRSGRILNVASTAAFQPGPYMAVYYASKAYVLSYSEALGYELRGTGITVTALCPGPTVSGFQERAVMRRARMVQGALLPLDSPAAVARAGYRGLLAGRPVVIPGLANWLLAESVRLAPRRLVTAISAWMSRPL